MEVKQQWLDHINKGFISAEVLGACIYTCNKRAKNERDIEYDLRAREQIHEANQHKKGKKAYYRTKMILLRLVRPKCIHIVRHMTPHDEYYYVDERYYLYYEIGSYSCHRPVPKENLPRYRYLPQIDVGGMYIEGADDTDLLPQDFVDMVAEQIEQKKLRLEREG